MILGIAMKVRTNAMYVFIRRRVSLTEIVLTAYPPFNVSESSLRSKTRLRDRQVNDRVLAAVRERTRSFVLCRGRTRPVSAKA